VHAHITSDGEIREHNDETKRKYRDIHMRSHDDEMWVILQHQKTFLLVDMLSAHWDGMHRIHMGKYKLFSSYEEAVMAARLTC
jgi:hypothetical protein